VKPRCRSCRSEQLQLVLDLGPRPSSDDFPLVADTAVDRLWPLELWLCDACSLAQLRPGTDVPPGEALAFVSATARARAAEAAGEVRRAAPLAATVRVIDSHHGGSWRDDLSAAGLAVVDDLADVVVDNHELSHQTDLAKALAQRTALVAPGGRLVMEFFHFQALIDEGQIDNVRHGHPLLLTLGALVPALARCGFEVVDAHRVPAYGGSLFVVARRISDVVGGQLPSGPSEGVADILASEGMSGVADATRLKSLGDRMLEQAGRLRTHLLRRRESGIRVVGYGAPSKACVLLGAAGVGPELLPYTVDRSPDKVGRRIPGCNVPIESVRKLFDDRPDEVLILCWDLADEIVREGPQLQAWGAKYWVPMPALAPCN
jgi:hypothetical protein